MLQFLEAGLASSTKKVYAAGWNRYCKFTNLYSISPNPITIEKATLFVAFLGTQGLAVSTIESYLAALRHMLVMSNPSCTNPSFHSPHMTVLLRGIKRVQSQAGPRLLRLPITASLMRRIKAALAGQPSSYNNVLLWAACCTGFFGFLRCGEFLVPDGVQFNQRDHLCLSDISIDTSTPSWTISLHIRVSKTDQFRQGSTVVLGSTGADICPVAAIVDYLQFRGSNPGPLFQLQDGKPLHRKLFTTQVQQALSLAGFDPSLFNGHSFRIGAATTANLVGVPETTIKLLGRWRSLAYQRYIRPPPAELALVSAQLAKGPN